MRRRGCGSQAEQSARAYRQVAMVGLRHCRRGPADGILAADSNDPAPFQLRIIVGSGSAEVVPVQRVPSEHVCNGLQSARGVHIRQSH